MEGNASQRKTLFTNPFDCLEDSGSLGDFLSSKKGIYSLTGLIDPARPLFLYSLSSDYSRKLVVLSSELEARRLYDEYRFFDRNSRFYPQKDLLFYESDLRSNELTTERVRVLKDIVSGEPITVFTTIQALLNKLPPSSSFGSVKLNLNVGSELDLENTREKLVSMGYEFSSMVSNPGEFSHRGGILDIFPLTEERPYRIELWADEIDSIRIFDADTQKSIDTVESLSIFPASELVMTEDIQARGIRLIKEDYEKTHKALRDAMKTEEAATLKHRIEDIFTYVDSGVDLSSLEPFLPYFYDSTSLLLDYFREDSILVLDDLSGLYNAAKASFDQFMDGMIGRLEHGFALKKQTTLMTEPDVLFYEMGKCRGFTFENIPSSEVPIEAKKGPAVKTKPFVNLNGSIPLLKKEIKNFKDKNYRIILCGNSRTRQNRLAEGLTEDGLQCFYTENQSELPAPGQVISTIASLSGSVEFPDAGIIFISENDVFGGSYKRRKKKAFKKGEQIESFRALNVGDYVVHENYGLGVYKGLNQIEQDGCMRDFLEIAYKGTDKLYVPVDQIDIITKYSGAGENPKLNSLSGNDWKKTKAGVRMAVDDLAKELVNLYALRNQDRGFSYGPDTTWQQEFEETFPYEETRGQLEALEEVKKDLMGPKIMDRLICGDVGFGKTEIAIRAAFKVVQENKQVAFLVPTTVLAKQHFNTFIERMKDYPVSVGMLSRFRTNAQNESTLAKLKSGELDIVIGTHRALSKDVVFKDLGLLVIDEEQRFGVRHKEKIKMLKNNVDVLSLSATPIPRTLHMSLVGIRDMSLLDEAPLERLPIQTFVFEENDEMIREAIEREISRGGQVYFVVNRIARIADIAARISTLVPRARVVFAHGRMNENELEDIMGDFVDGSIDVLVATTIIEIGLDISNVNTIIIHDADNFGLSQLYQLRGRVGRSNRTAYAFLMYRRDKMIKEVATKRLKAIKEFSDLGSGFKIAMRDLEIRGAGSVLGAQQHGHMEAVGYDLYCKLLSTALKTHRGEEVLPGFETTVDLVTESFVPAHYIPDESQKLEIYKRISFITDEESQQVIIDELIDRFGDPPASVISLIQVARLKAELHKAYVTRIYESGGLICFELLPTAPIDPAAIPDFVAAHGSELKFRADPNNPGFTYRYKGRQKTLIHDMIELAGEMFNSLVQTVAS